jgi:hypothetical protein
MNDPEFDNFLKMARFETPLPASFKSEVWHRIESGGAANSRKALWIETIMVALARPWGAVVGVAATVALGSWLGAVSPSTTRDTKVTYAESISPFASANRK